MQTSRVAPRQLVFENHCGTADALSRQIDIHFYTVGDSDKGNIAIHPIILAIESHGSLDPAGTAPGSVHRQQQGFLP